MHKKSITFYDKMSFAEQKKQIDAVPYEDKADLILRSHEPQKIIFSMNCEQFYLIYNSSGSEYHSSLLEIARKDQLLFASDFECWDDDEIDDAGFLSWLSIVSKSGRINILKWLMEADLEMLLAAFAKHIEVLKTEHLEAIDEYIGDKPFFTLDQLYYINIMGDDFDVVREVIDTLFELNKALYVQFLESLICVNELQVLEDAYQIRSERLSWYGFPEYNEAMKVFIPVKDWQQVEKKNDQMSENDFPAGNLLPVSVNEQANSFFDQVLKIIMEKYDDNDVSVELSSLANKIIIFDKMDFRKKDSLVKALTKANATLSVALEDLSQGSLAKAADILTSYWLEDIHRFGISLLQVLKKEAENSFLISGFVDVKDFMIFLGEPYNTIYEGLFKFVPEKNSGDLLADVENRQSFSSVSELNSMRKIVNDINHLIKLFIEHLGSDLKKALSNDYYKINTEAPFPSIVQFLATSFVNYVLSEKLSFEPVDINAMNLFLKKAYLLEDNLKIISKDLKESWKSLIIHDNMENSVPDQVLEIILEETSMINTDYPVEPSLIKDILIRES